MNFYISAIDYYLPEKIITNEFLHDQCGIDSNFLENKIGIKERRASAPDEKTSDLAVAAGHKLLSHCAIDKKEIDFLLVCTQNPDYRIPGIAGIIQHRLGLPQSCFAFDVNLACSGFVYSLAIAGNFLRNETARHALIIMAEEYTKTIDYKDRATAGLFGDGAAASLIEPCDNGFGYIDGVFGTDGSGADRLTLPNSGIVIDPDKRSSLFMDGQEIFKFAVRVVPQSMSALLDKNGLKPDAIKYFIFHQANQYMLNELKRRMKLTDEQVVIDFKFCGNTVASSIPIAFKNLVDKNRVTSGDLLVFCGFGGGLSWGSILYRFK
jgi:3-oxoacyl-[acyl-carrier-protein] synthase-3